METKDNIIKKLKYLEQTTVYLILPKHADVFWKKRGQIAKDLKEVTTEWLNKGRTWKMHIWAIKNSRPYNDQAFTLDGKQEWRKQFMELLGINCESLTEFLKLLTQTYRQNLGC